MVPPLLRMGAPGDEGEAVTKGEDGDDFGLNFKKIKPETRLKIHCVCTA